MSFLLTLAALITAGVALLHLLRLASGKLVLDAALGWFVGGGWYASVTAGLRFLLGVDYTRLVALLAVAAPVVALGLRCWLAPQGACPPCSVTSCWRPRPGWLFLPLVVNTLIVTYAIAVHGHDTPTQTDDALWVRALTPLLAFDDRWGAEARLLLPLTGSVSTWVPTFAWRLTGRLDHFHVNYAILTSFLSFIVLLVNLGCSRGRSEHGWACAFAVTSLPLFVFHCTSTYTDALLAIHVAAGLAFFLEYERTRDGADAQRALLLLVLAAFVKREGVWMAACVAGPLAIGLFMRRRAEVPKSTRPVVFFMLLVALLLDLATACAAVGIDEAFPVLKLLGTSGAATPSDLDVSPLRKEAALQFLHALFRSGNAGMLFWILGAVIVVRLPALLRTRRAMPLLALAAQFALTAISSVWLIPQHTIDGTTVHRALLTVSASTALWLAITLTDWVQEESRRGPVVRPALATGESEEVRAGGPPVP